MFNCCHLLLKISTVSYYTIRWVTCSTIVLRQRIAGYGSVTHQNMVIFINLVNRYSNNFRKNRIQITSMLTCFLWMNPVFLTSAKSTLPSRRSVTLVVSSRLSLFCLAPFFFLFHVTVFIFMHLDLCSSQEVEIKSCL